jgi:uncharacterized membrane protein
MNGSRQAALTSALVAVGAATRIVLDQIALASPTPLFGVMIKIGLTETLTIADGLAMGPTSGFVTGVLIVVVSDILTLPGAWTPFIAMIIGLLGLLAGLLQRRFRVEKPRDFALLALLLTILSEFLQNLWVSIFYSIPLPVTVSTGLPSLLTALVNNIVLLAAVGPRVMGLIKRAAGNADSRSVFR